MDADLLAANYNQQPDKQVTVCITKQIIHQVDFLKSFLENH